MASVTGRGEGHGKLILCGEHAVVYGYPAIAVAVDRATRVTLSRIDGETVVRSPHVDLRVRDAVCTVVPEDGFAVEVETDLLVRRGMGSSAALAVAVVRARADLAGETIAPDEVVRRAMPIERSFHGTPSGVDVAVSAHGGCVWFERGDPAVHRALPCPALPIVVLDSGEDRDTAQMVGRVAERRDDHQPALEAIGAIVAAASVCLDDVAALGALLDENHSLLRSIGVSSERLDAMVSLAKEHGAHGAKLAGAGGGGVVMALVDDPGPLLAAAHARNIHAFSCNVWIA